MALAHAQELDVIPITPLHAGVGDAVSTSLIRTERLQLLHVVLPAHQDMPTHHVDAPCMLHCLQGQVDVTMPGGARRLNAGELIVLPAGHAHGLHAQADSALLVTLLRAGVDGLGGGPGVAQPVA